MFRSFSITMYQSDREDFQAGNFFLVELMPGLIPFQLIIYMNG